MTDDSHNHTATTITGNLDNNARVAVRTTTGAVVGTRRRLNFIEGTNVTLTVTDDGVDEEVDVTITAAAAGGTIIVQEGDVDVDVAAATIDFNASDFAVTSAPAGEANVALEANLDRNARVAVNKNSGATVGTRRRLNFIEGTNVTLTIADDAGNEEVDTTIPAAGGGSLTVQENDVTVDAAATTLDFLGADFDVTSSPAGEANVQLATTLTANARGEGA